VEIGTEAAQFPAKEYINGIFLAVCVHILQNDRLNRKLIVYYLATFLGLLGGRGGGAEGVEGGRKSVGVAVVLGAGAPGAGESVELGEGVSGAGESVGMAVVVGAEVSGAVVELSGVLGVVESVEVAGELEVEVGAGISVETDSTELEDIVGSVGDEGDSDAVDEGMKCSWLVVGGGEGPSVAAEDTEVSPLPAEDTEVSPLPAEGTEVAPFPAEGAELSPFPAEGTKGFSVAAEGTVGYSVAAEGTEG
jgi:hypothetical protein